jgi:hypothetical protein
MLSTSKLDKLRLIVAALWSGNLLTVGYMVAPTLFTTLQDRALAGTIAGSMFAVQFWCSLVLGALMLVLLTRLPRQQRTLPSVLTVLILMCTLISHLGLQPEMAALRAQAGPILQGAAQSRFAILHGISASLYLLQSIAALFLLWRLA